MNRIPVWIDTDTGVDDATALLVAEHLKELEIVGVSAVAGNTTLDNAFRNARDVLSLAGREDVKVYAGSDRPLIRELETAAYVHGSNGLGGAEIPASNAVKETKKAWDALYEKAKELNGELIICALGPLTNLAITVAKYPDFPKYVKELNIMGGAANGGNVTPCAEFNIYVDPEAAENVFRSGIHVNMFGLDVTLKAYLDDADIAEISSYETASAKLFRDSNKLLLQSHIVKDRKGLCIHDACPVIYTARPQVFEGRDCGIYVETLGKITTGRTCTDLWTDYKYEDRHCTAFLEVDREAFTAILKETYRNI